METPPVPTVEVYPITDEMRTLVYDDHGYPIDHRLDLPPYWPPEVAAKAEELLRATDESGCPLCGSATGWLLTEGEDFQGRPRTELAYLPTWVLRNPADGTAWLVCEDCHTVVAPEGD